MPLLKRTLSLVQSLRRVLAALHFRYYRSIRDFPLLRGFIVSKLSDVCRGRVAYEEAVCNAGLVSFDDHYIAVAKNQQFSFCEELKPRIAPRRFTGKTDNGLRTLYRIEFDHEWRPLLIAPLKVILDGEYVQPVIFIEDVRLLCIGSKIIAFANGNGAWPLLGTLEGDVLRLNRAVADYVPPEKNWMPFIDGEMVRFEYSVQPHRILQFDHESYRCVESHRTALVDGTMPVVIHGGAPALRVDDSHFLGVGNSQHLYWFQDRYYAAVFYLFEAKPPFRIVKASRPLRLQSRAPRIQYVCGMVYEADNPRHLILSLGLNDCDNLLIRVTLEDILLQLHDVASLSTEVS